LLRKTFSEAKVMSPCLILMENIELLCPVRSAANTSDVQKRIVTSFLTLVDDVKKQERIFILASTSRLLDIDEAVKRSGRIETEVELSVPSESDRLLILHQLLETCGINRTECTEKSHSLTVSKEVIEYVAKNAHGMVGSDLLSLIKEACYHMNLRQHSSTASEGDISLLLQRQLNLKPVESQLTLDDFTLALKNVSPSSLREVTIEVPNVRWNDIGGMESVKAALKQVRNTFELFKLLLIRVRLLSCQLVILPCIKGPE
jgi:transitional endoplasmic reticulum ATPase